MATEEAVHLIGDFAQGKSGGSHDGKLARYECGNTDRLRYASPTYRDKEKNWEKWETKPKGVRIKNVRTVRKTERRANE